MKRFLRILGMTLAILLCCTGVSLSAQAAEDDFSQPCPVIENGVCLFKVIYPQDGDKVTVDSAKAIQKALEQKSGGKVTLSVDEGRPGKVYDSDALEILVGQTGHPEAAQAQKLLGYNQYGLFHVGNKICVVGVSPEALKSAANRLVNIANYRTVNGKSGTNLTVGSVYLKAYRMINCAFELPVFNGAECLGTYDCNDGAYKVFFRDVNEKEFNKYRKLLTDKGLTETAERVLGINTFVDAKWEKWDVLISYYRSLEEVGITFSKKLKAQPAIAEEEYTPVKPLLTQFDNNEVGGGMGYLIRLEDSTFIIVDGGMNPSGANEVANLYNAMKEQNTRADGKLIVRAWFITHAHNDHYNVLRKFCEVYANRVTVESLLFNPMASLYQSMTETPSGWDVREAASKFPGCTYVKIMAGQVLEYPGCTLEVLYTSDDVYMLESYTSYNDCSAVVRINVGGQSFIVLGDIQAKASPRIAEAWGDYLKSDMMQMAHHGERGGSVELYDYISPRVVLWPASISFYMNRRETITINKTLIARDYVEEIILAGEGQRTLTLPYIP